MWEQISRGSMKSIFIVGPPGNIQSAVCMFYGREQETHLLELAQYADTLREQTRQAPDPIITRVWKNRFERDGRANAIEATVAEPQAQSLPQISSLMSRTKEKTPPRNRSGANFGINQEVGRCRVLLALDHAMETCPFTGCFDKLAMIRKANFNSRHGDGRRGSNKKTSYAWQRRDNRSCARTEVVAANQVRTDVRPPSQILQRLKDSKAGPAPR